MAPNLINRIAISQCPRSYWRHLPAGRIMKILTNLTIALLLTAASTSAPAQDFPARPIRMIVPLTAGSGADIAGRLIGKYMSDAWHQPVVVENRPGAGGQIGTQAVARADGDGHTLLVQSASHAANSAIYKNLPYDPLKDLVDVARLGVTPYVMVTAPDGRYKSLKALIDAAKSNPGNIPFASAGVGTSTHLAAEYVNDLAGIKMLHVPYRGSPEAIQDTIAGRVAFYMAPINTVVGLVGEGKLAALGISTRARADILPQVVPLAEQGLPAYDVSLWFGMWAPAATPPAVVQILNAQVANILRNADVIEQFGKLGISPLTMTPDEFARFVRSEMVTYQRIVKQAAIPLQ
jgi:tripartite-type tricarboxylate transporter receptor subunit TctC